MPERGQDPRSVRARQRVLGHRAREARRAVRIRFFLKRGLGLRPVDERERDKDVWLDPLTRGSELHDIYAALLRRCRDAGRRPDAKKDGAWLTKLAQDALDRLNREMPPATTEILERESRGLPRGRRAVPRGGVRSDRLGADRLRGVVRASARRRRRGAGARRAGGDRPRRRPDVPDRRPHRPDRQGRARRSSRSSTTRPAASGATTGRARSTAAVAFSTRSTGWRPSNCCARATRTPKVTGASLLLLQPQGTPGAGADPGAVARADRGRARRPARADRRRRVRPRADEKACKWCDYEAACGGGVHEQAEGKLADAKLKAFGRLAAHA